MGYILEVINLKLLLIPQDSFNLLMKNKIILYMQNHRELMMSIIFLSVILKLIDLNTLILAGFAKDGWNVNFNIHQEHQEGLFPHHSFYI